MKIDKNKIIFISIVGLVLSFIILYAVFAMDNTSEAEVELKQPKVPELKEAQQEYNSKLDAINDLKEARESNAPSIYDESLLDSTGLYDPWLEEKERERIVDSIYKNGRIDYESGAIRQTYAEVGSGKNRNQEVDTTMIQNKKPDFSKAHEAFFNLVQNVIEEPIHATATKTDAFIMVEVNGEQTVRKDERLELRLAVEAIINDKEVPRNSLVYGFVSFKANRVFIKITNINNQPVNLKAFDLLDGNEGIYIKNSVQGQAKGEVLDDIVQDINIPGVPQVGGIKQVFRRNNRNVKATIYNQYQLILKPSL